MTKAFLSIAFLFMAILAKSLSTFSCDQSNARRLHDSLWTQIGFDFVILLCVKMRREMFFWHWNLIILSTRKFVNWLKWFGWFWLDDRIVWLSWKLATVIWQTDWKPAKKNNFDFRFDHYSDRISHNDLLNTRWQKPKRLTLCCHLKFT